jgi:chromosomal replication initiator protein
LVEIGNAFGGRDHSTVIHSLEKVQEGISTDPQLKTRINKIRGMLETFNFRSTASVERLTVS